MFVITPVSALHSYSYNPHYRHFDPYLAQQRAEQRARAEARIRRYQQDQLRKQLILDALHAQEYDECDNSPFYNYGYGPVCPPRRHCSALHYDAAIQQARRQAAIEQAAYRELKRLAAIKAQREERESHARRADAERFLSLFLDPQQRQDKTVSLHSLSNPLSGHSSQFQEIPAQPIASTSKVPVRDVPPQRPEGHLMTEYESDMRDALRSLFSSVLGGNSSEAPTISVSANPSVSGQGNEEGLSQDKGKGKELPQSDSEEEPPASPAQIDSSLSQITSIASRLETLIANFQFPAELDFSPERSPSPSYSALDTNDEFALTYTQTNAPLRAHEHALSLLLSELDNVSSFGSRVVKDARRAVVARVEEALEKLEKGVEERRGRVRARKAGSVNVGSVPEQNLESTTVNAEPVEQTAHPMDVDMDASPSEPEAADLMPVQVPFDEVPAAPVSVDVPIMDASTEGSAKLPDLINPTVLASSEISIEAPTSMPISVDLTNTFVTEPSVASASFMSNPASPLTTPSEGLAAQVSVPQDVSSPESEELLVNTVSTVSEEAGEHYPAEVVSAIELPASYPPAANEERSVSDSEAMKSPIPSSPLSEAEIDTFLLPASRPASPRLVPHNSDDEDVVVVNYQHENKDEDEWSHVE